jgi:hypothetical protein
MTLEKVGYVSASVLTPCVEPLSRGKREMDSYTGTIFCQASACSVPRGLNHFTRLQRSSSLYATVVRTSARWGDCAPNSSPHGIQPGFRTLSPGKLHSCQGERIWPTSARLPST